jgi:hypothetical protein
MLLWWGTVREVANIGGDSAFCGRSVIGKRGNGFWEGGKGTRDQRLMRRGDKRKYRRLGTAKKED